MAVGYRIDWPRPQGIDANSQVDPGSYYRVYENNTTTNVALFSDRAVTVSATNPVETSDDAANFPPRYVQTGALLTLVLFDSEDDELETFDDWEPIPTIDSAALALYLPLAGVVPMTGPINEKEGAVIPSATSVDFDAATGNFFHVSGTTTINTITLQSGYSRTVVFDGILTLTQSANLLLGGVSIVTHAGMALVFRGEGSGVTRLVGGMTASGRSIVESVSVTLPLGDQTTAIAIGTNKRKWRSPFAWTVTAIRGALATAQSSGANLVTLDVNNAGNSMLSTKVTLDNNETTSTTAATSPVLDATYVVIADDALIAIDIDNCDGSTTAAGVDITLIGYRLNIV